MSAPSLLIFLFTECGIIYQSSTPKQYSGTSGEKIVVSNNCPFTTIDFTATIVPQGSGNRWLVSYGPEHNKGFSVGVDDGQLQCSLSACEKGGQLFGPYGDSLTDEQWQQALSLLSYVQLTKVHPQLLDDSSSRDSHAHTNVCVLVSGARVDAAQREAELEASRQ